MPLPIAPDIPATDVLIAALYLAVSVLAGHGLGLVVQRPLRRVPAAALAVLLPIGWLALAWLAWLLARIGLWDALAMAGACTAGVLLARADLAQRATRWRIALVLLATLAGLGSAEWLVRLVLPTVTDGCALQVVSIALPRMDTERISQTRTPLSGEVMLSQCCALYPDQCPGDFADRTRRTPPATRAVLHLGDSLTEGFGLDTERGDRPFAAVLEAATPGVAQINAGQSATAPDYYLALERHWLPKLPVGLVVLHLFAGNDVDGMGSTFDCCAGQPLFDASHTPLRERCPLPQWEPGYGQSLRWFLAHSPPPSIVRALTPQSMLARLWVVQQERLRRMLEPGRGAASNNEDRERSAAPVVPNLERQWRELEHVLQTLDADLRARGIPLIVSVIPVRTALAKRDPHATEGWRICQRMLEMCRRLGLHTLDPGLAIETWARQDGLDAVFEARNGVHFNAEGHRRYAVWLMEQVGPQLALQASAIGSHSQTQPRPSAER